MKLPNGYGSVVKLSGKRRKPYAVRISVFGDVDGIPVRHRKYLEYFTTRKEALAYLADYNKGLAVTEHTNYSDLLTFKDLFNKWVDWKWSFNKHPGPAALKCYKSAFKQYAPLHDRKVATLRSSDLQDCLTAARAKSASTVSHMGVIVRGMWKYAISNEYLDRDITIGLVYESTTPEVPKHTRFSDAEVSMLWKSLGKIPDVDLVLIYIYTGMRCSELLEMRTENIHLDKHYMIGGVKTAAGKDRVIPIHDAILPLVAERLKSSGEYFLRSPRLPKYSGTNFRFSLFADVMSALGFEHLPHDCRYTFVSMAEKCGMDDLCLKIIVGHSIANATGTSFKVGGTGDITKNIYTEKTLDELITEVNKLPVL